MPSYYGCQNPYYGCENPLKEALTAIIGKEPPFELLGVRHSRELDPILSEKLYEWCTGNACPHWTTGLAILEAAEVLVERAVENGNI